MDDSITLKNSTKKAIILGSAIMYFFNLLYAFAMPVILPSILDSYGIMNQYALISGVNALLLCVITPVGGKLGDRFGRYQIGLTASLVRLILMAMCMLHTNGLIFTVLYALITIVSGILGSFPLAILSEVTTSAERPRYFGIFGAINGVALLIGLLGGGLIVDYIGAFHTFLIFIPVGLLYTIIIAVYYPHNENITDTEPIDITGIILLGCGISSLLVWCNFGGVSFGRISFIGISLITAGIIFLLLLIRHEKSCKNPFLNLNFFKNGKFLLSFLTSVLISPMVCLCSGILVLFAKISLELSATVSGTLALPKNIVFLILPVFLGKWLEKDLNRFKTIFLLCGFSIALGGLLASFWDIYTSIWTIYCTMIIFGIGTSCQSVCIQPYMISSIPSKELGAATSMTAFGNSLGIAVTTAIYGILYNDNYNTSGLALRQSMADTFSIMAVICGISGVFIILSTLRLNRVVSEYDSTQ